MKLGCMRCLCSMNENILSIVLFHEAVAFNWQKQPSRGVLKIYNKHTVNLLNIFRTPSPKNTSGGLLEHL